MTILWWGQMIPALRYGMTGGEKSKDKVRCKGNSKGKSKGNDQCGDSSLRSE
jgi:hypothetical protein